MLGWDLAGELIDATDDLPAGQKVIGMIPWFATGTGEGVLGAYAEVVLSRTTPEELIAAVRRLAPEGVDAVVDAASFGQGILGAARDGGDYVGFVLPAQPNITVAVSL